MSIYTLSTNYISCVCDDKSQMLNVFYKFPNPDNPYKAAVDKSKKVLDHYNSLAGNNSDFLTWLDWMSRKPQKFEVIDVLIPDNVGEEEMYLMVAAATRPYQKIIVQTHQYWTRFSYLENTNKIKYSNKEITVLDKDDAFKELNPPSVIIETDMNKENQKNNPWASGSFYLLSVLLLIVALSFLSRYVSPWAIPLIIVGVILIFGVVGAFQLRNDDRLKDESFLKLIFETYKRISFFNKEIGERDNKE